MNASTLLARQGRSLLQVGVVFLLLASLEGFAIENLAAPQLGLSAHKLAGLQSVLLLALGLVWPKLDLGPAAARTAGMSRRLLKLSKRSLRIEIYAASVI